MRPRAFNRLKKGFTIIEVVMAMMVLVLVLMSSLAAMTMGFHLIEEARLSTLASQILQSEMENLRLKNWTQICDVPASEPFTVESTMDPSSFGKFTCTRTVNDVTSDFKYVEVATSWTTMDGRPRTRRYMTYIGKNGLNDYYYRRF